MKTFNLWPLSCTENMPIWKNGVYCCYVPHHGKLYELDGLKAWPINHGETGSHWLEKAKSVITARIAKARDKEQGCHDIRYNLMSVVPSRKLLISHKLGKLKKLLQESLQVRLGYIFGRFFQIPQTSTWNYPLNLWRKFQDKIGSVKSWVKFMIKLGLRVKFHD